MNRSSRPEVLELQQQNQPGYAGASRTRSQSGSSLENPLSSNTSEASLTSLAYPPAAVSPEPAYIAPSAAARLVTGDHESFFQTLHEEGIVGPATPTIFVTEKSLQLVNQFLDFLLHSFFSVAKSTSLAALRPAVVEVLRVRLAREAVSGADQELSSYLGGEEDELEDTQNETEAALEWDLEKTWRRGRLQCMVYSSLGDLEEDDEAFYSEYSRLGGAVGPTEYERESAVPGVISPAVAIWLTSILEFIGEQTLLVAGHATIARYSTQRIAAATSQEHTEVTFPDRPMVEELDTEKVALNPSLGRMWRQWRKRVRGTRGSFSVSAKDVSRQQRLERREALLNTSDADMSKALLDKGDAGSTKPSKHVEGNISDEPTVNEKRGPEGILTPIVESEDTHGSRPMSEALPPEQEPQSPDSTRRRHSLVIIPMTTEAPFTFPSHPRVERRRSLPELERGDFADPRADGQSLDLPAENIVTRTISHEENKEQEFYTPSEERFKSSDDGMLAGSRDERADAFQPTLPPNAEADEETQSIPIEAPQPMAHISAIDEYEKSFEPVDPVRPAINRLSVVPETVSYTGEKSEDAVETEPVVPEHAAASEEATVDLSESPEPMPASPTGSKKSQKKERLITPIAVLPPSSTASEKATSVRVFTPPATPDKSRRSSSFSKGRPTHTSGSGSSAASGKLKNLVPWPSESSKYQKESDTDSHGSLHSSEKLDGKGRSFDELISSGGTIHCTITPDTIRGTTASDSQPPKTPTADLADFLRSTGPGSPPGRGKANTSKPLPQSPKRSIGESSASKGYRSPSSNGAMEDGDDVLDYTRSGSSDSYSRVPASSAAMTSLPSVLRQIRSTSPSSYNYNQSRLVARDASGTGGCDTTSALADFFRNTTPPVDGEHMPAHRISRSVAPFRNTMDSEQFDSVGDGEAVGDHAESIKDPSFVTSSAPHHESYQSSFTSSTALLRSNSRKNPDHGSSGTIGTFGSFDAPKRKQSRVKDPYSLDFDELDDDDDDDEDEVDDLDLILPQKRQEESLIDFLNSVPPPPSAPPVSDDPASRLVQKKSSSVSLMSRFGRSARKNSIASNADKMPPMPPTKHVPLPVAPTSRSDQQSIRSVSTGSHQRMPSYPVADGDRFLPSVPRGAPRGIAARGGRTERNDTDSLADFLKHTGPPPSMQPPPSVKEEGSRSMLKKISFSRSKKRSEVM